MEQKTNKTILTEEQFNDLQKYLGVLWREIERCEEARAYLAGCIIAAAFLEALLLSVTDLFPEETEKAIKSLCKKKMLHKKEIVKYGLKELLLISFEAGWIPYKGTEEPEKGELGDWLLNYVRELRNWIHPGKKIREYTKMRITEKRFLAVVEIIEATRDLLLKKVFNSIEAKLKAQKILENSSL